MSSQVIVHIVYIHGFQGDHTSFQSFPTDLHKELLPALPAHIDLRSILYPTYKSKRPIAVAAQNFLNWLETLPPGPVILCGHSMGGLLAAEAATSRTHASAKRVTALLAFDVPYLGMHPHVVISGIASLLPNKKGDSVKDGSAQGGGLKSEREMNDARHVQVPAAEGHSPSASGTSFAPPGSPGPPPLPPRPSSHNNPSPARPPSPSSTPAFLSRTFDLLHAHANDPLVRFITKHRSEPLAAAKRWVVESFEFGSCMFDPQGLRARYMALERWRGDWVAFWSETAPGARRDEKVEGGGEGGEAQEQGGPGKESRDEGVRKEREATASLGRLLEPSVSHTSISTGSRSPSPSSTSPPSTPAPDAPLPTYGPPTKSEHKAVLKQHDKDRKALAKSTKQQQKALKALQKQHTPGAPHHFIVRPSGTAPRGRWERVRVRGAGDEVEAHCGLFLRDVNWEYDAFVGRVGDVVGGWVRGVEKEGR